MKVYDIQLDRPNLAVVPQGDRYYELAQDTNMMVYTDIGLWMFGIKAGFVTNFRSGGPLVDMFVDQIGDQQKSLIYLGHDLCYTPCDYCNGEHPVSRRLGDEFLRDGLAWAGMGKCKRNMVYYAVRACGNGAYEEDDRLTESNRKLFTFEWKAA